MRLWSVIPSKTGRSDKKFPVSKRCVFLMLLSAFVLYFVNRGALKQNPNCYIYHKSMAIKRFTEYVCGYYKNLHNLKNNKDVAKEIGPYLYEM